MCLQCTSCHFHCGMYLLFSLKRSHSLGFPDLINMDYMSLHQNKQPLLPLILFSRWSTVLFLISFCIWVISFPTFIVSVLGHQNDCNDKENTGAMLMQLYMTDWTISAKIDLPVTPLSPLMSCCFFKET